MDPILDRSMEVDEYDNERDIGDIMLPYVVELRIDPNQTPEGGRKSERFTTITLIMATGYRFEMTLFSDKDLELYAGCDMGRFVPYRRYVPVEE
jgi:hypothetical protein